MDEEKIKQENIMLVEKTKKMIEEMTMTPVQKEKLRNPKYDTIPNSVTSLGYRCFYGCI